MVHEEISALDMQNGMTYVGQFIGRFNVALTNYFIIPTLEWVKLEKQKNKSHIEVMAEEYRQRKDSLNRNNYLIKNSKIVSHIPDIFKNFREAS